MEGKNDRVELREGREPADDLFVRRDLVVKFVHPVAVFHVDSHLAQSYCSTSVRSSVPCRLLPSPQNSEEAPDSSS